MRNLLNTFIIIILFTNYLFSQENTNVDTNYLKSNLNDSILKNTIFRNGDKIIISKDEVEWNANNEKNIPTLYINKNEYYYNFRAITDERNIFPIGYKLPSFYEINYLLNNQNLNKRKISFGSIDENGRVKAEIDNSWCWIKDKYNDNIEFANTIHIKKVNYGFENELSVDLKVNGHVVFCLEDLSESIKTKTYDYKLLMPNDYKILKSKIINLFPFNSDIKNGDKIEITSNINFTSSGENTSRITTFKSSFFDKMIELNYKNNLQSLLNTTISKPVYKGQNVIAISELKINISFYKKIEHDLESYFTDDYHQKVKLFNSISSSLNEDIINAKEHGLNPKIEYQSKVIFINNQKVDSINRYVLSSIKYDYFRNNLFCIIPGLGIINAEPNRKRIPGIKLFHISLPLGVLSLGSLIYSSIEYKNYRNSIDFSESKFKKANFLHKVFLSTAATYTLLGLIDFSMTFKIGLKNKKLTNKINNEIQNKHNGYLLLN